MEDLPLHANLEGAGRAEGTDVVNEVNPKMVEKLVAIWLQYGWLQYWQSPEVSAYVPCVICAYLHRCEQERWALCLLVYQFDLVMIETSDD